MGQVIDADKITDMVIEEDDEDDDEDDGVYDYSIPWLHGLDRELYKICAADDKRKFLSFVKRVEASALPETKKFLVRPSELLMAVCKVNAVKCAAALIDGKTGHGANLNAPNSKGIFPLHFAASIYFPEILELLLYRGARTDIRFKHDQPKFNQKLPVNIAVESLRFFEEVRCWTPKQSIFKLLMVLCIPNLQNKMESIAIVAWATEETEEEIRNYARDGKLLELTALLMVAQKKLTRSVSTISEYFSTQIALLTLEESKFIYKILLRSSKLTNIKDKKSVMLAGQQLLKVFERAGDDIDTYLRQDKTEVLCEQVIIDVAYLLREAGFILYPQHTDFRDMEGFHELLRTSSMFREMGVRAGDWREPAVDKGMQHFEKSGHRWPRNVSVEKMDQVMDAEKITDMVIDEIDVDDDDDDDDDDYSIPWLDGLDRELYKICAADDKRKFLSFVKRVEASAVPETKKFLVRPYELLMAVCNVNAVKCAAALIDGETGHDVDLNAPDSKGIFPLHFAASTYFPEIIELLLYRGARTDIRFKHDQPKFNQKLPVNIAVESLRFFEEVRCWTPKQSIFKLLMVLCIPNLQNKMESIAIVAWATEETEEEIWNYAREGKLLELTALLMVAQKKLTRSVTTISEYISSQIALLTLEESKFIYKILLRSSKLTNIKDKKSVMLAGQQLLKVFERAGDDIDTYLRQDKTEVLCEQVIIDVAYLLRQAGFILYPQHTDFRDMEGFHELLKASRMFREMGVRAGDWREPAVDMGMQHFGKSGHRWPRNVYIEKLGAPVLNERRSFHTLRDMKASSISKFSTAVDAEKNTVKRVEVYLPNILVSKPWAALAASVIKRGLRCI